LAVVASVSAHASRAEEYNHKKSKRKDPEGSSRSKAFYPFRLLELSRFLQCQNRQFIGKENQSNP
jgi:hypothetical protein